MKVLITGGAGFIGSHFVEYFQGKAEIVVLDNLRTGYRSNVENFDCRFIEGSITDKYALSGAMDGVDTVFHLAAMISVTESMEKPAECLEINSLGTVNVLEAARDCGVKSMVLASSAAVYGDNPVMPKREDMLPEPKSPYAIGKLDGEYLYTMFRNEYGILCTSLRFFNVFGPRQDPKSQYAAAIPIFIYRALRNEDIIIYGDGTQVRDFVYVKDVVQAGVLAAEKGENVYNVARGEHITVQEIAEQIISLTGSSSRIVHDAPRAGDIHTSYASIDKLRKLGYKPAENQLESLSETIEFFRNRL